MDKNAIRFTLLVTALALMYLAIMVVASPMAGNLITTIFISIVFIASLIYSFYFRYRDRRLIAGVNILATVQLKKKGFQIYNAFVFLLFAAVGMLLLYGGVRAVLSGRQFGNISLLLYVCAIAFFVLPIVLTIADFKKEKSLKFTDNGIACGSSFYRWDEIKQYRWINSSSDESELFIKVKHWFIPFFIRFWGYRFDIDTEKNIESIIKDKTGI